MDAAAASQRIARIHLKIESDSSRKRILASIAELDIEARLYIAPMRGVSQWAARDCCLRSMVPDLCALGVSNLYLESCSQDRQDALVLASARSAAAQQSRFHFDHRAPSAEPLLWLLDAIARAWAETAFGADGWRAWLRRPSQWLPDSAKPGRLTIPQSCRAHFLWLMPALNVRCTEFTKAV